MTRAHCCRHAMNEAEVGRDQKRLGLQHAHGILVMVVMVMAALSLTRLYPCSFRADHHSAPVTSFLKAIGPCILKDRGLDLALFDRIKPLLAIEKYGRLVDRKSAKKLVSPAAKLYAKNG